MTPLTHRMRRNSSIGPVPSAAFSIDLSSNNSPFGSMPISWLGSRATRHPMMGIRHGSIERYVSTCRGRQADLGDPELSPVEGTISVPGMPGRFDSVRMADGGEIELKIAKWRATADEDGHYSFAVAP